MFDEMIIKMLYILFRIECLCCTSNEMLTVYSNVQLTWMDDTLTQSLFGFLAVLNGQCLPIFVIWNSANVGFLQLIRGYKQTFYSYSFSTNVHNRVTNVSDILTIN